MKNGKEALVVPVLVITLGVGWLLTAQGYGSGINWVWSLGLAAVGILLLASGINKATVVLGPFLVAGSLFSLLRQTNRIALDAELPILVIVVGLLLLVARLPSVPAPSWYFQDATPHE